MYINVGTMTRIAIVRNIAEDIEGSLPRCGRRVEGESCAAREAFSAYGQL